MTKNRQIVLLAFIVLLFGAFIFYYSFRSKSPPPLTAEELKREQLKASENNPIVELSPAETKLKQAQLKASEKNPVVKLTPEQIKLKQLQLTQSQ